ncbi:hypothetical protein PVAP13_6KG056700 [Panicum virgatum]|uniref:Uncharacterized protein n=1 Tax=Panicum virgatum TaxID=38727 RepID=A0A8T0R788_PANVG|nr:hypothetical protein PVAP13_6KG056700 [Panicum virgatum]
MTMFTMMKSRRSSQGLLLLALLLLAFSVIPALISGESMIEGGRKGKMTTGANETEIILDVFNGCTPHDARASRFRCRKDGLYWPSLSECVINCPCKVRCHH